MDMKSCNPHCLNTAMLLCVPCSVNRANMIQLSTKAPTAELEAHCQRHTFVIPGDLNAEARLRHWLANPTLFYRWLSQCNLDSPAAACAALLLLTLELAYEMFEVLGTCSGRPQLVHIPKTGGTAIMYVGLMHNLFWGGFAWKGPCGDAWKESAYPWARPRESNDKMSVDVYRHCS